MQRAGRGTLASLAPLIVHPFAVYCDCDTALNNRFV
jgi:hypothetical protein